MYTDQIFFNNTLLSQGHDLENSSHCGNGGWNAHSKDKGGIEEPRIARVQLSDQPVVTSSHNLLQQKRVGFFIRKVNIKLK